MEITSTVKTKWKKNLFTERNEKCRVSRSLTYGCKMPYKTEDLIVLVIARVTKLRIATVYRAWRAVKRFTIS